AVRKPFVTILQKTDEGKLLQCEVQGAFYEPVVEWKDSDGNILPSKKTKDSKTDRHYDINLQTTVTKTDNYSCVATQKEISHQIYATIYVE
ncbi:hemicentin-1-like, partial [Scomber scombrus]